MSASPVPDAPTPFDASWRQEAGDGLDADGLALIDQAVAWAEPRFEGQQALTGSRWLRTERAWSASWPACTPMPPPRGGPAGRLAHRPDRACAGAAQRSCRHRVWPGSGAAGAGTRRCCDWAWWPGTPATPPPRAVRKGNAAQDAAGHGRRPAHRAADGLRRALRWHAESKTPCSVEFARETLTRRWPTGSASGRSSGKWKTWRSASWSPTATSRSRACWKRNGSSAKPSSPAPSSACNRRWPPAACTPRSAAGPSISTASGTRCASSVWTSPRCTTCARCASSSTTCATAIRRWAWCTRCGRPSPRNSTTIFRGPSPTATARCIRWWPTTTAGPSRCRSARARCTSSPSTAWPRTGAIKRPAPRAGRSPRPANDRQLSWMRQLLAWNSEVEAGDQAPVAPAAPEPAKPATRGAGRRVMLPPNRHRAMSAST